MSPITVWAAQSGDCISKQSLGTRERGARTQQRDGWPGLGGPGLYARLERERPALLDRAIFVTGDLAAPESVKFVDGCRCPVLPKPFEFEQLFRALERRASPARVG